MADNHPHAFDRRRVYGNLALGTIAVGAAALLITPKVRALLDGSLDVIGMGAVANLALLAGGVLFLNEARKAYAAALKRPDQVASLSAGSAELPRAPGRKTEVVSSAPNDTVS